MTKRFLSLFLALLMMFSLAIPAFAEEAEEQDILTDEEIQELVDSGEAFQFEETPEVDETPDAEEIPEAGEVPETEEMPETEEVPEIEEVPEAEETPAAEENADAEAQPAVEEEPAVFEVPVAPVPETEVVPEAEDEIMPISDWADSGNCGSPIWVLSSDKSTLTISGSGAMEDYSTGKSAPWAEYKNDITTVEIDPNVTSIGAYAFYTCTKLENVTIGSGVTSIGQYAFSGCNALTSIEIPSKVRTIGQSAFSNCSALANVTINKGVTSIGQSAFSGCIALSGVILPDSVTSIGPYAFNNCSALTAIAIPDSVTTIGNYAFYGCSMLANATIGAGVTNMGTRAFFQCYALESVTIKNGVTGLGTQTFDSCTNLTSIDIPASVTSLSASLFEGCKRLEAVNVDAKNKSYASDNGVVLNADKTTVVFCPVGKTGDYTIPSTVKTVGNDSFLSNSLTSVVVPATTTVIASNAFSSNTLERVTIQYPECQIDDSERTLGNPDTTVIYGYTGSTAETYAKRFGYEFVSIGDGSKLATPKLTEAKSYANGVTVSWEAVPGAVKYRVFYKNASGTWTKIGESTSTSYFWTGAVGGTKYTFTVRCITKDGTAYTSSYDSTGITLTHYPCAAPKITALSNTASGVSITWNAVSGAAKYRVFYKNGSSWTKIADTTATSYTWTGAKSGTNYTFTVRCINSAGSAYTSTYDSTGKSITYLSAPAISAVSNAATGVKITWGKVSGAEKYRVFYKNGSSWKKIADTTSTSYTWTGAKTGTKYTFTVRCINSAGTSYTSSYNATGKSITYVAAPKLSAVSNTKTGVKITWGKVSGVAKYRVFYKTGSGSWKKIADTASTSYTWTGAKTGVKYTFTVRCLSSDGKSYTSGYDTAGLSTTFYAIPTVSTLTNTASGVKITWGKIGDGLIYRVYYKTEGGSWKKIADTKSTSYTWTGAKPNTKYSFTLRCLSSDGKTFVTSYNNTGKSITYLATPGLTSLVKTSTSITINWGKVSGAAKYRVFYKTGSGSWKRIGDTTSTSYTWTGAKAGTSYTFTVRCISSDAKSYTSGYDAGGLSITA